MSTLSPADLHADVVSLFSPAHAPARPGLVGAELELLAAGPPDLDGRPSVLPLRDGEGPSLVRFLERYGVETERLAADWDLYGTPRFRTRREGMIVFEPGGQLEFSTEPRPSAAGALADLEDVLPPIVEAAAGEGIRLVARGLDPWHEPEEVGLQLCTPRYRLMDAFFAEEPTDGRRMMRLTAGLQVNLDFGDPVQARRRWRAANLLAPVCTAAFANSPCPLPDGSLARCGRAVVWETTDASRTGVVIGDGPTARERPWEEYLAFALRARVMMRLGPDGVPVAPGGRFGFGEWCAGAFAPPPTAEEWRVHLTTLFPEVRPRGWLEIRCLDVPRPEWWGVPLTFLPALLYDDAALEAALARLEPLAAGRWERARRAARLALEDPELAALAGDLFRIALDAARRFPDGWFSPAMLAATASFAERYVARRITQADEEAGVPVR